MLQLTCRGRQDEAYELGRQWGNLYEPGSPSRKVIEDLMETSLLVNVVHNDFMDPEAIFRPFFKAGEDYAAQAGVAGAKPNGVNGHIH